MEYYDIQKNWRKLKPHFQAEDLQVVWQEGLSRFEYIRAYDNWKKGFRSDKPFEMWKPSKFELPTTTESCDWRAMYPERTGKRGPQPAYFDYVRHGACHYMVDFYWHVANRALPEYDWIVVSSDTHSTVWAVGTDILFDPQFLALGIDADEAWEMASDEDTVEEYTPKDPSCYGAPQRDNYDKESQGWVDYYYACRDLCDEPLAQQST